MTIAVYIFPRLTASVISAGVLPLFCCNVIIIPKVPYYFNIQFLGFSCAVMYAFLKCPLSSFDILHDVIMGRNSFNAVSNSFLLLYDILIFSMSIYSFRSGKTLLISSIYVQP